MSSTREFAGVCCARPVVIDSELSIASALSLKADNYQSEKDNSTQLRKWHTPTCRRRRRRWGIGRRALRSTISIRASTPGKSATTGWTGNANRSRGTGWGSHRLSKKGRALAHIRIHLTDTRQVQSSGGLDAPKWLRWTDKSVTFITHSTGWILLSFRNLPDQRVLELQVDDYITQGD